MWALCQVWHSVAMPRGWGFCHCVPLWGLRQVALPKEACSLSGGRACALWESKNYFCLRNLGTAVIELSHPKSYCVFSALPLVLFQTHTSGSHQRSLEWSQGQEMGTQPVSWQRACLSLEAMNSWWVISVTVNWWALGKEGVDTQDTDRGRTRGCVCIPSHCHFVT